MARKTGNTNKNSKSTTRKFRSKAFTYTKDGKLRSGTLDLEAVCKAVLEGRKP